MSPTTASGARSACTPSTLATGKTATCTASYTVTQADVEAGHVTNAATATGTTPNDDHVAARPTDRPSTRGRVPDITLVKSAFPATYAAPGEQINYTYTVTNTGNVTLHGITADRQQARRGHLPGDRAAPIKSMTCSADHMTTQADVDAGHITNAATVTGHPPTGPAGDRHRHGDRDGDSPPGIELDKTASPTEFAARARRISYTYTVTNTGNVTLRGIALTDGRLGAVTCPVSQLAPGASMTCTASTSPRRRTWTPATSSTRPT